MINNNEEFEHSCPSIKVTICVPVYNGSLYLSETLSSIAKQTYQNVEVIIVDNGSTDNSVEIARNYCEKYDQFQLVVNEKNIGGGPNFNKCLSLGAGELIAIFHADDVYHPEIIKESVDLFQESCISLVGSLGEMINERGEKINKEFSIPKNLKDKILSFDDIYPAVCNTGNGFLVCPTMVIRRSKIQEIGVFNFEDFQSAVDLAFWFEYSLKSRIFINSKKRVSYRLHNQQSTQKQIRENIYLPDSIKVVRFYKKFYKKPLTGYNGYISFHIILTLFKRVLRRDFRYSNKLLCLSWNYYKASSLWKSRDLKTLVCIVAMSFDIRIRNNVLSRLIDRLRK